MAAMAALAARRASGRAAGLSRRGVCAYVCASWPTRFAAARDLMSEEHAQKANHQHREASAAFHNERAILEHVPGNSRAGDADGVLSAVRTSANARAQTMAGKAGLALRVKVLIGSLQERVSSIPAHFGELRGQRPIDFVLCDRGGGLLAPDLGMLEMHGAVGPGTVVAADARAHPGEKENEAGENAWNKYLEGNPACRVRPIGGGPTTHD